MSLIDEELDRRDAEEVVEESQEGSSFGFRDYVKSKKKSLDKYKEKKALQREVDSQSMKLQVKLDREAALEDYKKDKRKLKDIKRLKHAEKTAAKVRDYEEGQMRKVKKAKFDSSPMGKIVRGFDKVGRGMDSFDNSKVGKGLKRKYSSSDPFGFSGGVFDMPQGVSKKMKGKKRKNNDRSDIFRL